MTGILNIISAPIGNLGDASLRMIEAIKDSHLILSEDTRNSKKLFRLLNININDKKIISCNQHNEKSRFNLIVKNLKLNNNISLISDAGSPTISDPGTNVVNFVVENGFKINIVPGPSSIIAALMGSGFDANRYIFLGFLPRKGVKRKQIILDSMNLGFTLVIFESALRVKNTLKDLYDWCGEKKVVLARELTKKYESFHRGLLGFDLIPEIIIKGEIVIMIESKKNKNSSIVRDDFCNNSILNSLTPKKIAKSLSSTYNVTTRDAYEFIIDYKK